MKNRSHLWHQRERARDRFGFVARRRLEEGVRETVEWYLTEGRGKVAAG